MLRSTRSRRLLRRPLTALDRLRRHGDLLLGQQEGCCSARSRRGPSAWWKRRGSISVAPRPAALAPAVELGAAEPEAAARAVLLEWHGASRGELVERRDAHAEVLRRVAGCKPAIGFPRAPQHVRLDESWAEAFCE